MKMFRSTALVAGTAFTLACAGGCAHPQTVTLTSASAPTAPAPTGEASPAAPAPVVPPVAPSPSAASGDDADTASGSGAASPPKAEPSQEMSFAQLTAALGHDEKLSLDINTAPAPTTKGLSANGYAAVGAVHQAVASSSGTRAGDLKISGGISVAAVRAAVREQSGRLRSCYEHGLASDPHLSGRVLVSFSVDEHGTVDDVDAESDVIPPAVMSCVKDAFSAMTFAPPKAPPAKVVYPVDFNQDS
jgi:hypothetical protein